MARPAGLFYVGATDGKFCLCVIETNFTPAVFGMAFHAISFRIIFAVEVTRVDVLVTIAASAAYVTERPGIGFFMAGQARGRQVRTL